MSMKDLVKRYETVPPEGNPRRSEAWALTQAALRMKSAQESGEEAAMLTAVRTNWQLWTIIQSELLSPQCTVPTDIRQNVLSLSNFIDKHTVGFIAKPQERKLGVLITINRELAAGLNIQVPDPDAEEPDAGEPPASGLSTDLSA